MCACVVCRYVCIQVRPQVVIVSLKKIHFRSHFTSACAAREVDMSMALVAQVIYTRLSKYCILRKIKLHGACISVLMYRVYHLNHPIIPTPIQTPPFVRLIMVCVHLRLKSSLPDVVVHGSCEDFPSSEGGEIGRGDSTTAPHPLQAGLVSRQLANVPNSSRTAIAHACCGFF